MADWVIVLSLVGFGVLLMLVEFFFVPGTTVVGILGFACTLIGLYFGYSYFGTETGHLITAGAAVVTIFAFVYSFRSNTWNRLALKNKIEGSVNDEVMPLQVGDMGKTVSALRPLGSAEFGGDIYEVRTIGNFMDSGKVVRIVRVEEGMRVYVEPLA